MAISGISSYSTARITGLYSGLDTDTLIQNMVATQQAKVDKLFQQKEKAQWKHDAYSVLNTSASSLKDKYMSVLSNNSLMKSSTFNAFKVVSSDSSAIEITSSPESLPTNFHILNASRAIAAIAVSRNFNVQIHRSDTIAEYQQKIGGNIESNYQVSVNGKIFTFDSSTTISEMMNTINQADLGASLTFSEITNSFQLSSTETGAQSTLDFSGFEVFGLNTDAIKSGKDAQVTVQFDGQNPYALTQSSNEFTLDGLTFNVKSDYSGDNGAISVSVERDYQSTINAIKSFVEDYNKLVEDLNKQYRADKYYDYAPLTETQREELDEKEIELWDEKAKSGILRNDLYIGNLLTNLRSTLSEKIGETGLSAMDIGISTVSWNSSDWKTSQGKIELDEEKLLTALKENSDRVQEVFSGIGEDGESVGFVSKMSDHISTFNKSMREQGIYNTKKSISSYSEKMDAALEKLYERQEYYYAQYAQLETLMANMQSQSSWLSSQLSMF